MGSLPTRMCLGKESYDSKGEANWVLSYLRTKAINEEDCFYENLRIYKCPFCQKYHLGSR
jgi:hypothetical protein